MDTDLSANWSSRQQQAEVTANRTPQSNVAATHNPSVTSPAVHASGSYQTDSTMLGGSQQSGTIQHCIGMGTEPRTEEEQSTSETQKKSLFERIKSRVGKFMDYVREVPLPRTQNFDEWENSDSDSDLYFTPPTSPSHPSLEPALVSTEEIPLPSHAPPNRELPEFFDKYGILRKQQVPGDGRCAEGVVATILNEFGIPEMTTEEFKREMADEEATVTKLKKLARKKGLKAERYDVKNFVENRITGIENVKAFMIVLPTNFDFFHGVAMVHPDKKERFLLTKYFHESDSYDQNKSKRKKYSGDTAQDALLDYETQNNVIANAVLTFREIVSADGPEFMFSKGCALFDRSLWEKAIEAYDEVITCLCKEKEPKQPVLLAGALHNRGLALYKSGSWKEAIEDYKEVIMRFGKADDPALRKIVEKARDNKGVALDKQSVHGDGEQTGE